MTGRLRRLWRWSQEPRNQRKIALVLVGMGISSLRWLIEDTVTRLDELEDGLAELDGVASLDDVERAIDGRLGPKEPAAGSPAGGWFPAAPPRAAGAP